MYSMQERNKPPYNNDRRPSCHQNDSIGLAESPGSLTLDDEPASLTDAEFREVGMDAWRRRERRGRVVTVEAAGLVGETLDASSAESLVAEGELKAPSLGRRILRVGVASDLVPAGAIGVWPFTVGGVQGLSGRDEPLALFLEAEVGGTSSVGGFASGSGLMVTVRDDEAFGG